MHPLAVASLCLLAAGLSFWGWGWLLERTLRCGPFRWPVTIALGLAIVVWIGGWLNLAHLARARPLDALLVAGLLAGLVGIARAGKPPWSAFGFGAVVAAMPCVAAAAFVGLCLLPPAAYNIHDDFEKYFALPVRMLATGTLAPNPLGSLGAETLGGQAVLHALVAAHFPLTYLGAVDAWFCLVLCLVLVVFGRPVGRLGIGAAVAGMTAWVIDPTLVNVASAFSGAALIAAAVLIGVRVSEADGRGPGGAALGLTYAGLIALKPTFAPFVVLHLVTLSLANLSWRRRSLAWAGWALLGLAAGLLPWVLLHLPLYLTPAQAPLAIPPGVNDPIALFSRALNGYGTSQLPYTVVALVALALGGTAILRLRNAPADRVSVLAAAASAGISAAAMYFLFVTIGAPRVFGPYGAMRYACPALIATVPCLMRLLESDVGEKRPRLFAAVMAVVAAGIAVLFLPATIERPKLWWREHTSLAFFSSAPPARKSAYRGYNRQVFSGLTRSNLEFAQSLVPAGEPLGAWVMTPFLLDYRRNPIFDTDPAGLSQRWTHWPEGVHYFLLEQSGFAVRGTASLEEGAQSNLPIERLSATRALAFLVDLHARAKSGKVLYADGSYVLLRFE